MKDAYYFSHDSNARHDPKILEMRAAYGAKGYGWYWMIIEILRDQEAYRIKVKDSIWGVSFFTSIVPLFHQHCTSPITIVNIKS